MTSEIAVDTSPTALAARTKIAPRRKPFGVWFRRTGGRHLFATVAAVFALFPVVWIVSASFNASNSLSSG